MNIYDTFYETMLVWRPLLLKNSDGFRFNHTVMNRYLFYAKNIYFLKNLTSKT